MKNSNGQPINSADAKSRAADLNVMCQLHLWRVHRLFCRPDADPERPPLPGPVAGTGDPDHGHAGLPPHRGKDGRQGVGRGNPRG